MKRLTVAGVGSALFIKDIDSDAFKESYLFLRDIDRVSINGVETRFESVEMPPIASYLGYAPGHTNLKWICGDSDSELFDIGVEFMLPDADEYKIMIQHCVAGEQLGPIYLIDMINVNGEDVLTPDKVIPAGMFSSIIQL